MYKKLALFFGQIYIVMVCDNDFFIFSDKGLNISHFNAVMLKGSEEQVITGKWKIEKLFIDGDFEALINNLYLRNDVVHEYNKDIALVTGRKSFINVKTRNINTEYINDVRLSNWFLNSVYLNKSFNQIIQGKVTLVQPVFFDDIQVQGLVNNIYFSNKTILTKSHEQQVLTGNVYIKTKFPVNSIFKLKIKNLTQFIFSKRT